MAEESLLRWCWPMVPLRPGKTGIVIRASGDVMFDRRPGECENIQLPAETLPRPGNTVRLLYRKVWDRIEFRSYYAATDADLRTCQDLFPDSEPGDPPWLQVEAELVTAGNSSSELRTDTALTLLNRLKASRRPPEPESTPNTFGRLLEDLRNHDATRKLANRTGAKATGSLEVGSASANYVLECAKFHADANKIWAAIMARLEVGRVQAICEANTGRFDSEAMRMIRGQLCVSLNVEPSFVDTMGLAEFSEAWRVNNFGDDWRDKRGDEMTPKVPTDIATLPKGVSLLDVALLLVEGDVAAAKETRKRWHNSRNPELPDSIGEDSEDCRAGLYSLSAIFDFIKIVEVRSESEIADYRQRIQHRVRRIRLPTIV